MYIIYRAFLIKGIRQPSFNMDKQYKHTLTHYVLRLPATNSWTDCDEIQTLTIWQKNFFPPPTPPLKSGFQKFCKSKYFIWMQRGPQSHSKPKQQTCRCMWLKGKKKGGEKGKAAERHRHKMHLFGVTCQFSQWLGCLFSPWLLRLQLGSSNKHFFFAHQCVSCALTVVSVSNCPFLSRDC